MSMINDSAIARARSMLKAIELSLTQGLAERNVLTAQGYFVSLLDCGLIERNQYEDLMVEAELARDQWRH